MSRRAGIPAIVLASIWAGAVQAQPVTACDRLAGLVHLPRVEGEPGVYALRDPDEAIRACEAAATSYPAQPWFKLLLARALLVANTADPRAIRLYTEATEGLPALAAAHLGVLYEYGYAGLPVSDRTARDFYRQSCEHWPDPQSAMGCTGEAVLMIEGRGGDTDEANGFRLLDFACREGWGPACVEQAYQIELRGEGGPDDVAALFATGCEAGDLLACSQLGFRYELGEGAPLDMGRAQALYRQACDGGEPQGCSNLGEIYRSGLGVQQDVVEAVRLFQIGCDGQDAYACLTLGNILIDGRGVPADARRARAAFDAACHLGDPEACDMVLEHH
ncbi:MAG: sel1 repeat family protein [Rhodobacter sp.]|nr:sel1 repeat family protein [Paracoccaceae bacterium]MCC0076396.1 sel1 repeat family protein [Rhodobacter sp.]